jgi:glyoxylase-like metal-dependent hydrolase (beta-lactamase superfamily II)
MSHLKVLQIQVGPMMNYSYLICDEKTSECAVVDPGWETGEIIGAAKKEGLRISKILLTHTHFDHTGALEELAEKTGADVYVHKNELDAVPKTCRANTTEDGTAIKFGPYTIECIHTPGHSPGSQCFLVDGNLFTGDTLFVDGCGRVDLPGGSPKELIASLKKLSFLPRETVVFPGHDYGRAAKSTIGDELDRNPYMTANSESFFL